MRPLRAEVEGQLRRQTIDEDFALGCALALLDRGGLRASSIVAGALQDVDPADMKKRKDALKQSVKASARFLANTPTVAKGSYLHPLVQAAFTDE